MTRLVRAGNPGPMTLDGTNTWLVGSARVLVVDPGPDDDDHLRAVLAEVARDGGVLGGVLLTHRHHDHAEALGSPLLREARRRGRCRRAGRRTPPWARRRSRRPLAAATDEPVRPVPLPGHTDDSLGLVLPRRGEVLTGDTVLGRGTSVVAHPDGHLGDYLASLDAPARARRGADGRRRAGVAGPAGPRAGARGPGRGRGRAARPPARRASPRSGRAPGAASRRGGRTPRPADDALVAAVVAAVYPEVDDPVLQEAAARTVRATLVHLGGGRRVSEQGTSRWQVLGERQVYDSPWLTVHLLDVVHPDGTRYDHHAVRQTAAAVACVVRREDGAVLLMRRHRVVPDVWGWEVPAGRVEPGEGVEEAAARETVEETGWTVRGVRRVTGFHPLGGSSDQRFEVCVAEADEQVGSHDPVEADRLGWFSLEERARARARRGGAGGAEPGGAAVAAQRARRVSRSTSRIVTARASSRSQPRPAKSASALLTVSRLAPTSWASSSWVSSCATRTPSST